LNGQVADAGWPNGRFNGHLAREQTLGAHRRACCSPEAAQEACVRGTEKRLFGEVVGCSSSVAPGSPCAPRDPVLLVASVLGTESSEENRMRVATLFKRLLGCDGGRVVGVEVIGELGEQVVVVDLARRRNRRCSGCGRRCRAIDDRRLVRGGTWMCFGFAARSGASVCPGCGITADVVPWARLEGMNSTVRLISHRARGFRRLDPLLAMITLICGRVPVQRPTSIPGEPERRRRRRRHGPRTRPQGRLDRGGSPGGRPAVTRSEPAGVT
jgi:hypothetical protein